jgi:hypothetical protein
MATLTSYLLEVQRLLHDANLNFYTQSQLTDYINEARKRVCRDTGCLRTIQVTQAPCKVPASATINGATPAYPTPWVASTTVIANTFVFSNIFIYQYVTGGTSGTSAPPYPANTTNNYTNFPPSSSFADGTATLQYVGNVENVNYVSLPQGSNTLDIVNINLYWGNTRYPLDWLAWSDFNARMRFWQNYIGQPLAFSLYGQGQIYLGPVPDQIYQLEIDTTILPTDLSLSTPTVADAIVDPFTSPVKFYAAYLAKYYEQSFGEAEIYKQEYTKHITSVLNTTYTRRIPNIYSSPY